MLLNNVLCTLQKLTERADVVPTGPVTVHGLRKCCGKNGARCLSPDVLKSYMGHSDVAITLEYYTKRDAEDDARARWVLGAIMRGESVHDFRLSDVQSDVSTDSRRRRVS